MQLTGYIKKLFCFLFSKIAEFQKNKKLSLVILIVSLPIFLFSQNKSIVPESAKTNDNIIIAFKNNQKIKADYISHDSTKIVVTTKDYLILEIRLSEISKIEIKETQKYKAESYPKKIYDDTTDSGLYYVFSGSALGNPEKGLTLRSNLFVINSADYCFSETFSAGGGADFYSTVTQLVDKKFFPAAYVYSKATYKISENFHEGFGVSVFSFPGNWNSASPVTKNIVAPVASMFFTYGNANKNITLESGYAFNKLTGFYAGLAFAIRINDYAYFISESKFEVKSRFLISCGAFRFFNSASSLDLGYVIGGYSIRIAYPYIGLTYKIGRKKS